jgi:hypothetical protein
MVIGNLTQRERKFDILADIRDLHTIDDKSRRINQLESIAESITELKSNHAALRDLVINLAGIWQIDCTSSAGYTIADDINTLHDIAAHAFKM